MGREIGGQAIRELAPTRARALRRGTHRARARQPRPAWSRARVCSEGGRDRLPSSPGCGRAGRPPGDRPLHPCRLRPGSRNPQAVDAACVRCSPGRKLARQLSDRRDASLRKSASKADENPCACRCAGMDRSLRPNAIAAPSYLATPRVDRRPLEPRRRRESSARTFAHRAHAGRGRTARPGPRSLDRWPAKSSAHGWLRNPPTSASKSWPPSPGARRAAAVGVVELEDRGLGQASGAQAVRVLRVAFDLDRPAVELVTSRPRPRRRGPWRWRSAGARRGSVLPGGAANGTISSSGQRQAVRPARASEAPITFRKRARVAAGKRSQLVVGELRSRGPPGTRASAASSSRLRQ